MRHLFRGILVLGLLAGLARADVLILKDGRKLSGRVTEKKDGYEIQIEGETLAFDKGDVARHVKSPREIVGDADQLLAEAKAIYLEAVEIKDDKAADAKFRQALPKVTKAREAYAEARDLFPEGNSDLDTKLVQIMKLMRLVRERIGSDLAGTPTPVVKPREEAPPTAVIKPPPSPPKEPPPASFGLVEAFAVLQTPADRADETKRGQARAILSKAASEKGPLGDLASAGAALLSRPDDQWGLAKAESLQALQDFHKAVDLAKFDVASDKAVAGAVQALGVKVREVRSRSATDPAGDALGLVVAAAASALIARSGGKPPVELEAAFKDLQYEKSEVADLWGRKDGLAMDDYRRWVQSGEYSLGVVQFESEYRSLPDFNVKYALGILMVFKAVADNRNYTRAASFLEQASRNAPGAQARDHLVAFGKSVRAEAPCPACGGTHKVNCQTCKGKKKVDLICGKCGGSGAINSLRGVVKCSGFCGGKGRLNDQPCPRCKQAGQVDCKAKGCTRPVSQPAFASFAEAYKCALCKGKGSLTRHVAQACPDCSGVGLVLQPKADPSKLLR